MQLSRRVTYQPNIGIWQLKISIRLALRNLNNSLRVEEDIRVKEEEEVGIATIVVIITIVATLHIVVMEVSFTIQWVTCIEVEVEEVVIEVVQLLDKEIIIIGIATMLQSSEIFRFFVSLQINDHVYGLQTKQFFIRNK